MNDKEFVLDNVETINADVKDIDELCCALEHSTIFAIDYIQTFATDLLKLQYENNQLQSNWNSLREDLKRYDLTYLHETGEHQLADAIEDILDKMNELEKSDNK